MIPPLQVRLPPSVGKRMQLGLVVSDMDAAIAYWTEIMGVGPFVMFDESVGDRKFFHRGALSPVQMAIAFSYLGEIQIELIKQTNSAPSPYNEFLGSGREGLHHIGFWPENYEEVGNDLERSGFKEVSFICLSDGTKNASYYDTPSSIGIMVELIPLTAARIKYFGGIKAMADNWDGSRPLRRYASRAEFMASDDCRS